MVRFWLGFSFWLAEGHLFTVSSQVLCLMCLNRGQTPVPIRTHILLGDPYLRDLVLASLPPQRPYFQLGVRAQHKNLGRTNISAHNSPQHGNIYLHDVNEEWAEEEDCKSEEEHRASH